MPTYEYECEKCKQVFEAFQSIKAEPLTVCTQEGCGGPVHRLFSKGAGFIFKGGGFYQTDYRSESYKKAAQADSASSTPASTPAKSDTTPSSAAAPSTATTAAKPSTTAAV
jgi:putative FmdB family regulatory protein